MPPQTFADRLRTARHHRRYDQETLAAMTHLDQAHVSHFETGRRLPSFDVLVRIVRALNVSADYLLGFTDRMERTRK
jgi:transcriptional regulator with XRE-family HTH domain